LRTPRPASERQRSQNREIRRLLAQKARREALLPDSTPNLDRAKMKRRARQHDESERSPGRWPCAVATHAKESRPGRWYSIQEAAELLGFPVSRHTLVAAINKLGLKFWHIKVNEHEMKMQVPGGALVALCRLVRPNFRGLDHEFHKVDRRQTWRGLQDRLMRGRLSEGALKEGSMARKVKHTAAHPGFEKVAA